MANKKPASKQSTPPTSQVGNGGELHQTSTGGAVLTTNQGLPIADDQEAPH